MGSPGTGDHARARRRPRRRRCADAAVAGAAHHASSASASGSTRGCRWGSPTGRWRTSRTRSGSTARRRSTTCCCTSGCRSPARRRRPRARCRCVFALLRCRSAWWAGHTLFGTRAAWMAAVLAATNPFLTAYAQETRMYALAALLALVGSATFARAFAADADARARRPWAVGFAVALAALLYTHNWALFFGAACGAVWLYLVVRAPAGRRGATCSSPGAVGFGGALVLYLPWIPITLYQAAHTGRAVGGGAERPGAARHARADARSFAQVALILVGGRGSGDAVAPPRRPPHARRPRRRRACSPSAVLTVVLAWLASQLSPAWANRYLAVGVAPLLLSAAGRARARRAARHRRARRGRRAGRRRHRAGRQEQRARGRRGDRAEPRARRHRRLDPARAGVRARLLPARGRALRDAHRARCATPA